MRRGEPNGEDIAELLLRCAPQSILIDLELTTETRDDFVDRFNMSYEPHCIVNRYKTDLIALALYYSNINVTNHMKYLDYVTNERLNPLYIAPEVIYSLTQLAKIEEFYEVNKLKDDINAGDLYKINEIIKRTKERLDVFGNGPKAKKKQTKEKYTPVKENFYDYMKANPEASKGVVMIFSINNDWTPPGTQKRRAHESTPECPNPIKRCEKRVGCDVLEDERRLRFWNIADDML